MIKIKRKYDVISLNNDGLPFSVIFMLNCYFSIEYLAVFLRKMGVYTLQYILGLNLFCRLNRKTNSKPRCFRISQQND